MASERVLNLFILLTFALFLNQSAARAENDVIEPGNEDFELSSILDSESPNSEVMMDHSDRLTNPEYRISEIILSLPDKPESQVKAMAPNKAARAMVETSRKRRQQGGSFNGGGFFFGGTYPYPIADGATCGCPTQSCCPDSTWDDHYYCCFSADFSPKMITSVALISLMAFVRATFL